MLSLLALIAIVVVVIFMVNKSKKTTSAHDTRSSVQEKQRIEPIHTEHAEEAPSPNSTENHPSTKPAAPDKEMLVQQLISSNKQQQNIAIAELEKCPMPLRGQIEWESSRRFEQSNGAKAKYYLAEAAMHGCSEAQFRLALNCIEDAVKDSDSPGIIEAEYWLGLAEKNGITEAATKLSQIRGSAYQWRRYRQVLCAN